MKKLVLFLVVIILILVGIAVIWLATFDINQYKGEIANQFEKATGYPIEINSLGFSLKHGLSLQVNDFEVRSKPGQASPNPFLFQANKFFLKIDLTSLLKRQIEVKECILESPKLEFSSFVLTFESIHVPQISDLNIGLKTSGSNQNSFKELRIPKIQFVNGSFQYKDNSFRKLFALNADHINLELQNVSLASPVGFQGSADVFLGLMRQVNVEGTFSYPDQNLFFELSLDRAVKTTGTIQRIFSMPVYQLKITATDFDVASLYSAEQKNREYFSGLLSSESEVSTKGRTADEIKNSMLGKGWVRVKSGALKNRNLVRENLEKITAIPGLNQLFDSDLGAEISSLLKSPDTVFDALDAKFRIGGKQILIDSLSAIYSEYAANLWGSYLLEGPLDLKANLQLGTKLSDALTHKVKELNYLADASGHMVIPFVIQGKLPGVQVTPNVQNLVNQAVQNVAPELIDKALTSLLKSKQKKRAAAEAAAQQNDTQN